MHSRQAELQVLRENQARQALAVLLEVMEHPGLLDRLEQTGHQELMEQLDLLAQQVRQALKEIPGLE
jgi:hypothetical protein